MSSLQKTQKTIAKTLQKILPQRLYYLILYILFPKSTAIVVGNPIYNEDRLATPHNFDFTKDPHFIQAYETAIKATGTPFINIRWRMHVILWAATHAMHLEGDFVECGVFRGFLSRTIMEYIDWTLISKKFYLMDTYKGLVPEHITEAEKRRGIDTIVYDNIYEVTKEVFRNFPNAEIIRGPIPDTLPLVQTDKVCYIHIDMNNVTPEIAAAEYFWPKMVSGALMILDDYGHKAHLEQKLAFDRFAEERGISILSLPTGQGLIIKP